MSDFPVSLSNVQDGVTEIQAKHINNLEATLGITGSAVPGSHDYRLAQLEAAIGVVKGHGQCRLFKSGANLVLTPYNGNRLMIGGVSYEIPSPLISLAPTGLSADTTYFIYAYMAGATMTLVASGAAPVIDSYGVMVASGDANRTLVGMARVIAGPAWQDTNAQRFVLSYFNRKPIVSSGGYAVTRSYAGTAYAYPGPELYFEFITWSDEMVDYFVQGIGNMTSGGGGQWYNTSVAFDGASNVESDCVLYDSVGSTIGRRIFSHGVKKILSNGYHTVGHVAKTDGLDTVNFLGSSSGLQRTSAYLVLRG